MKFATVMGMLIAAYVLAARSAQAIEGVDGTLFHPQMVDAEVEGCQVSKPGNHEIQTGNATELIYAYRPKATPKKVSFELTGESVKASDLGVRQIEQRRGKGTASRIVLFFNTVKAGESSITLTIDGQQYAYTFNVQ